MSTLSLFSTALLPIKVKQYCQQSKICHTNCNVKYDSNGTQTTETCDKRKLNTKENCTKLKFLNKTQSGSSSSSHSFTNIVQTSDNSDININNDDDDDISNCTTIKGDVLIMMRTRTTCPTWLQHNMSLLSSALCHCYWLSELLLLPLFLLPLWTSGRLLFRNTLCILNEVMLLFLSLPSMLSTTTKTTKAAATISRTRIMSSSKVTVNPYIFHKISSNVDLQQPKVFPVISTKFSLPSLLKFSILLLFVSSIKSSTNNLVFCSIVVQNNNTSSAINNSTVTTTLTITAPSMSTPLYQQSTVSTTTVDQLLSSLSNVQYQNSKYQNLTTPTANQNISSTQTTTTLLPLSTDRSVKIAKAKQTGSVVALLNNDITNVLVKISKINQIVNNRTTLTTISPITTTNSQSISKTTNTNLPLESTTLLNLVSFTKNVIVSNSSNSNKNNSRNSSSNYNQTFQNLAVTKNNTSLSSLFPTNLTRKEKFKTTTTTKNTIRNIENNNNTNNNANSIHNNNNNLHSKNKSTAELLQTNNSTSPTDQKQHNNILTLKCEYGTIRKYKLKQLANSFAFKRIHTEATILVKCLNQITWELPDGNADSNHATNNGRDDDDDEQSLDKLNGQKFLVYISDFKTNGDAALDNDDDLDFKQTQQTFQRRKRRDEGFKEPGQLVENAGSRRGVLQYFQYIWNDIKSIWPFEPGQEEISGHDEFDQDMLQSMEYELKSGCKTFGQFSDDYYYGVDALASTANGAANKCANCIPLSNTATSSNPLSKLALPFWFIQLNDGSVPQIRFTKSDTNIGVKNFKKLVVSYLVTKLSTLDSTNLQHSQVIPEYSVLGFYRAHYRQLNHSATNSVINSNISLEDDDVEEDVHTKDDDSFINPISLSKNILEKIVTSNDLIIDSFQQQQQPLQLPLLQLQLPRQPNSSNIRELYSNANSNLHQIDQLNHRQSKFNYNFKAYQQQTIDDGTIQLSTGQINHTVDQFAELSQYLSTINQHSLKKVQFYKHSKNDLYILNQRFGEQFKETLVAQTSTKESVLQEKYHNLLNRLRTKLGHNEYQYYTKLYEYGTSGHNSKDYNQVYSIVSLEQQLNFTLNQIQKQNSLIGDIRRVGTIHNIQLVCGLSLANIEQSDKCSAFLSLLLKCSSKTAQHLLLYTVQSDTNSQAKRTKAVHLLVQTHRPSRWLIENLAHETHRQASNRMIEATLMQTLAILAQNERLNKLKELLNVYLVKRIDETTKITADSSPLSSSELYLIELIDMLSCLNNYTAIESVQQHLINSGNLVPFATSELVKIATIQAYRRSINRSQVQSHLADLFVNANSCQIKQEIVQLLIDNVDSIFWEETTDKKWPQYGFNELDQIVANELKESDNNCVHHLIIDYFKRKINSKAHRYMEQYEAKQNFNASSFDFCVKQQQLQQQPEQKQPLQNYKCDYVQKHGTNLVSVFMTKTVQFPNLQPSSPAVTAGANSIISSSYSKYSINVEILNYKLTFGHLAVIQTSNQSDQSSQLLIKLTTYKSQVIPLTNFLILPNRHSNLANKYPLKIAQFKQNTPVRVAWRQPTLQYENSLLLQMNANVEVYLVAKPSCHKCGSVENDKPIKNNNNNNNLVLQIKIQLDTSGEILTTSLTRKSSFKIKNTFDYQSNQPINFIDEHPKSALATFEPNSAELQKQQQPIQQTNNINYNETEKEEQEEEEEEINYKCLGNEIIHNQIEIFQDYSKRYNSQCNAWNDTPLVNQQKLYHWNSTLKQSNLLTLTVDPLPIY